jgi:hypothetical protein
LRKQITGKQVYFGNFKYNLHVCQWGHDAKNMRYNLGVVMLNARGSIQNSLGSYFQVISFFAYMKN